MAVATYFLVLFPNVMPSSTNPDWNLTVANASSTDYTLKVMTIVALIFTPIVLMYQAGRTGSSEAPDRQAHSRGRPARDRLALTRPTDPTLDPSTHPTRETHSVKPSTHDSSGRSLPPGGPSPSSPRPASRAASRRSPRPSRCRRSSSRSSRGPTSRRPSPGCSGSSRAGLPRRDDGAGRRVGGRLGVVGAAGGAAAPVGQPSTPTRGSSRAPPSRSRPRARRPWSRMPPASSRRS